MGNNGNAKSENFDLGQEILYVDCATCEAKIVKRLSKWLEKLSEPADSSVMSLKLVGTSIDKNISKKTKLTLSV